MSPPRKKGRPRCCLTMDRFSLGGEQLGAVQCDDELTTDEQFFEGRAVAQRLLVQNSLPERSGVLVAGSSGNFGCIEHAHPFSNSRAARARETGWPTGLEPATARTTIWGSTIELWPPSRTTLNFMGRFANSAPLRALPGVAWRGGSTNIRRLKR